MTSKSYIIRSYVFLRTCYELLQMGEGKGYKYPRTGRLIASFVYYEDYFSRLGQLGPDATVSETTRSKPFPFRLNSEKKLYQHTGISTFF